MRGHFLQGSRRSAMSQTAVSVWAFNDSPVSDSAAAEQCSCSYLKACGTLAKQDYSQTWAGLQWHQINGLVKPWFGSSFFFFFFLGLPLTTMSVDNELSTLVFAGVSLTGLSRCVWLWANEQSELLLHVKMIRQENDDNQRLLEAMHLIGRFARHHCQHDYCYLLHEKKHTVGGVKLIRQLSLIEVEDCTLRWLIWFFFLTHTPLRNNWLSFGDLKAIWQCSSDSNMLSVGGANNSQPQYEYLDSSWGCAQITRATKISLISPG